MYKQHNPQVNSKGSTLCDRRDIALKHAFYLTVPHRAFLLEKNVPELLNIIDSSCCEGEANLIKSNSIS
jgi:hypothetical protein